MTEDEWAASPNPAPMLEFLRGKVSDRKLRLFAAASFRRLAYLLPDGRQHRGIEMLEEEADGTATREAKRDVTRGVRQALPTTGQSRRDAAPDDPYYVALMFYRAVASSSAAGHALAATAGLADSAPAHREQARLLRDVIGDPFHPSPSLPAGVLAWGAGTVRRLAEAAYEERQPPLETLDTARLAILADALLDAGCDDEELMAHLRSKGPHVRGCWAVDRVLKKD